MNQKHKILLRTLVLLFSVFSLSTLASSLVFARPINASIVFDSNKDGNYEIYKMNADGSGTTRLTNSANIDAYPNWSPDGTKIVFYSTRDGNYEIYSMNADGSSPTRLTNNAAIDAYPAWSPDGTKIVFSSDRNGNHEIYSMNANGSGQTRLTTTSAANLRPAWSPDGTKIAFTTTRDGNAEIYSMNANGSSPVNLTNTVAGEDYPVWSPDGTKIAYLSYATGNGDVYSMNADGTGQTRLTTTTNDEEYSLNWSPDGTKIIFGKYDTNYTVSEIYTMNTNGSGITQLTNYPGKYSEHPSWQSVAIGTTTTDPDGRITTTITSNQDYSAYNFTLLNNETLILDGSLCDVIVSSGGILQGTGHACTITVNSGGTIAPGHSPGCIASGNLNLAGTYTAQLAGMTACSGYDQLQVTGTVAVGGTLNIALLNGFTPATGDSFTLIANDGVDPVTGTFAGLPEGSTITIGTSRFSISYLGGDGNDVTLTALANLPGLPQTGNGTKENSPGIFATIVIVAFGISTLLIKRRVAILQK